MVPELRNKKDIGELFFNLLITFESLYVFLYDTNTFKLSFPSNTHKSLFLKKYKFDEPISSALCDS